MWAVAVPVCSLDKPYRLDIKLSARTINLNFRYVYYTNTLCFMLEGYSNIFIVREVTICLLIVYIKKGEKKTLDTTNNIFRTIKQHRFEFSQPIVGLRYC